MTTSKKRQRFLDKIVSRRVRRVPKPKWPKLFIYTSHETGTEYCVFADNEANAEIFLRTHYNSDTPQSVKALEYLLSKAPRVEENVVGFVGNVKLLKVNHA